MQFKQKQSRGLILWLALGLVLFSNQACSEGGSRVALPAKTQMVLAVGQDGSVTVLDPGGKPVSKCQLCTRELEKQFGPYCKEASVKSGVCAGLTGVTVQDISAVTLINTHKNPYCMCSVINGNGFCLPVGCNTQ
jgi:hypothetical protein